MDSIHPTENPGLSAPRNRALVALTLLLPAPIIGTAASLLIWPEGAVGKGLFAASKLWIVLLPLVWWRLVQRQPISWSPPRKGGVGVAALAGLLIAGGILVSYLVLTQWGLIDAQLISERVSKTGLSDLSAYVIGAIYWITLNSLMEEYVWRWFVFRQFETVMRSALAVVAASLAFTAHHVIALAAHFPWPIVVVGSLGVFVGGLTWSWLYLRYRSVWPCYVSHAIVDAPIFWIGYDLIFRRGN